MKKTLLILAIVFCIFQMIVMAAAIDIGVEQAIGVNGSDSTYTKVNIGNPANATGKITSVDIYVENWATMENIEIATFSADGNDLTTRDTESVANQVQGAKRTVVVDLDVVEGDYIGIYYTDGGIGRSTVTGDGYWYLGGDQIPCSGATFSVQSTAQIGLYGTGATGFALVNFNGVVITKWNASEITKWNGLEIQ